MLTQCAPLQIIKVDLPAGLHVVGDVDTCTVSQLAAALDDLTASEREVHLYLDELTFMDGRGITLLLNTAYQLHDGGRLIVHALPGHLIRLMHLTGWDTTPGLVFAED